MKTLLVRLSSMGDLIHTLPAINDLSQMRPEIELHWLCEESFADIARLHPFVKKIHTLKWRFWRKHLTKSQTWAEIRGLKKELSNCYFDDVLDSQGLFKSVIFAKFAQAPIMGLDFYSARERWSSFFYNKKYFVAKNNNAVWRNRVLFSQAFNYQMPSEQKFGLVVPKEISLNYLPEQYYVALHATSRDSKLWPSENWLALFSKMYEYNQLPIYLPWGNQKEKNRAEEFAKKLPFIHVCEPLSLLQAAYLLKYAQCVIGVDTGLLHLANALDTPVVGIYTDTDPAKTGVQISSWSENLGNIGKIPTVNTVYSAMMDCMVNKEKWLNQNL